MIEPSTEVLLDPQNRHPGIELGVIDLSFGLAATMEDTAVQIWKEPLELVGYLLSFDEIVTFNGDKFDFPLLSAEAARAGNPNLVDPRVIIQDAVFCDLYSRFAARSRDVLSVIKQHTGSVVGLANAAHATLDVQKKHKLVDTIALLQNRDLFAAVNFSLEGAALAYNLAYVMRNLKKLMILGPDDAVVAFDVP